MLHEIVGEYETKLDEFGYPATTLHGGRSPKRVSCEACNQTGLPFGRWLESHRKHVMCSCGKVVSKRGFFAHRSSSLRHEAKQNAV